MPTAPVALVLGAEVFADGRLSPALANRLDVGIELDAAGERTLASCLQARDSFGLHRLIVVSQEQHMARAVYTCRRVGVDADGVVAPELTGDRVLIYQVRERFALVFALIEVNVRALIGRA